MSPTPTDKKRKLPTLMTDDMKRKIASEYRAARKSEKAGIRARYNISTGAVNDWIAKGFASPSRRAARGEKVDRTLEELLWAVVITARERGEVDTAEARRLLELVR